MPAWTFSENLLDELRRSAGGRQAGRQTDRQVGMHRLCAVSHQSHFANHFARSDKSLVGASFTVDFEQSFLHYVESHLVVLTINH